MVLIAALYRAIPNRPWGFAPQFAIAIFGGAVLSNKKWAFVLTLSSMLISDIFYQLLYQYGISIIPGVYEGMWINYALFASLTAIGFFINPSKISSVVKGAIASPTLFFIASNFVTWLGNGGYQRPKTMMGLMQAYADGIPFYGNSLVATFVFGTILFGSHYFMLRSKPQYQVSSK
jgi:hypothetical protein